MNSRLAMTREKISAALGKLGPREGVKSIALEELESLYAAHSSYRVSAQLLNESLGRSGETRFEARKLCADMERLGAKIKTDMETQSRTVMDRRADWRAESKEPEGENWKHSKEEIRKIAEEYNKKRTCKEEMIQEDALEAEYETVAYATYLCADEIGVHQQKERRDKGKAGQETGVKKKRKYVRNAVVSVHTDEGDGWRRFFAGTDMRGVFGWTLACLIAGKLLRERKLICFADGASNIRDILKDTFAPRPYRVILDWYHLCKKLGELLSMALKGKEARNASLEKLERILWAGNVEEAIAYLREIDGKLVKAPDRLNSAIVYLRKHQDEIPCYALRAGLGLRNSSQAVESANFALVANRQKIGGMSWSNDGSEALSLIRTLYENGDAQQWFRSRSFSMFRCDSIENIAV